MLILKNNPSEEGIIETPLNQYGNQYSFCMFFNNETEVAFADSYFELLEALIPMYSQQDENTQEYLRIKLAQQAAAEIQAEILYTVDLETLALKEQKILTHPKHLPQLPIEWWTSEIPIVVVETAYQPYTDVIKPASSHEPEDNIWRINPLEEEQFLFNLHEIGYIRLLQTIESA